jgi:hypothetical protein
LIDENVRSVLLVGADANDAVTDTLIERLRAADCSTEVARTPERRAESAVFDCIVIRNSAPFPEVWSDAVTSARVLVVCESESFRGHQIVSGMLSQPDWEFVGSDEDVWNGCVVLRRIDLSHSGAAWEILDVLHRPSAISR